MATIVEMLEKNALKYPDDIALIELRPSKNYRQTITWKEFNDNANRIANYLIEKGIQRDDKVIHWMRNSIPWLGNLLRHHQDRRLGSPFELSL